MKRILLSLFALASISAFAQNDLSVDLEEPMAGSTVGPGIAFDFQVKVSNIGTTDITAQDTLVWAPRLNGNFLTTTQGGQTVPIIFFQTGSVVAGGTGVVRDTVSFGGLNIQNQSAGAIDFCGWTNAVGPNWRGITEDDETNNEICNSVNYDPNGGTMNVTENVLQGKPKILDGSFYADGMYNTRVYNVFSGDVKLSFIDLSGRTIADYELNSNGGKVEQNIDMSSFKEGILLAVIEVDGKMINTKKIMVH